MLQPLRCALSTVVAMALAILAPHSASAALILLSTDFFFVTCTSTGQLCDPPKTLVVHVTSRRLKITRITYNASGAVTCSPGRIRISVDGQPVGSTRFIEAGERASVKPRRLKLPRGEHTLSFQFEGRPGGCNDGFVTAWSGVIKVAGRGRIG